ncbi:MAG TPA: ABC transporter ATP-binding protein [Flavipsychrobacter sp.]|nr:ABC transporter ATP-binding protein [Flavipsychrobacter sp.]
MKSEPLNVLTVNHLQICFPQKNEEPFLAVKDLSFTLQKGKVLAIVGESGSGKSLTALAFMGLLPKSAMVNGTVFLQTAAQKYQLGTSLSAKDWQTIRGSEVGMIFQEPMSSLNPVMTVGRQLQETLMAHQPLSNAEAKKRAIAWLRDVKISQPEQSYHKYPHELSGGQKQRVMIAMAMCNSPAVLIADEPTTALDVTVQSEIIKLMKQLQQKENAAMIFITHDLSLASEIADEVLVMYKGAVMEYDHAANIFQSPQNAYTRALIACKPSVEDKGKPLPVVADFMNDIPLGSGKSYPVLATNDVLLNVKDLKIWFGEKTHWWNKEDSYFKAVDNVSFELMRGEVLGLVGESGCGKSTLSKSLMGLLPVREGQILYEGNDISKHTAAQRRKLSTEIQMIFQDPYSSLNPRLTVGELLTEPMKVHQIVLPGDLKKEALRLLDLVQLPTDAFQRYPHQFSGGQRQRIGIARALSLRPKLLICDESVSALDVSVQAQILNLLKDLQQELSLSYLFISHDLSVVHYISDRVMVMQSGNIVEQGDATQVLHHPQHIYTQKLIEAMPELK